MIKREIAMNKRRIFLYLFFIFSPIYLNIYSKLNDWTWSYRKKFSADEAKDFNQKATIIFSKVDVPEFNQLIFSWNSMRPKKGYFSFYVQPRYAITKQWGNWYKMVDWGAGVQKSYRVINDFDAQYHYVRLELPNEKFADGFRIKVEPKKGVDLSLIRLIGVCISNLSQFNPESITNDILSLPSVLIKNVPKKSQFSINHSDNHKMCSPTSTCMLVSFLTKKNLDSSKFAKKAYDNGLEVYGSWPFNLAHAFEICPSYYYRVARLSSFPELYAYLKREIPVVVSIRGKLPGSAKDYDNGHLVLVIGWDRKKKEVIVHDPAFDADHKVVKRYDICSFLKAWEKSHRLAYVVDIR